MKLFNRELRLNIAGEIIQDGLRIDFNVNKTLTGFANSATIKIFNLSDKTISAISEDGAPIELEAGYKDAKNIGLIFKGTSMEVGTTVNLNGLDKITTIVAGDGLAGKFNLEHKGHEWINETYKKGTSVKNMVKHVVEKYMVGVTTGNLDALDKFPPLKYKWAFDGVMLFQLLDELSKTYGLYWSIQNHALEIITYDGFDDFAVLLKGVIGHPEKSNTGIIVNSLLNPDLAPNKTVEWEQNQYRIDGVRHKGSNMSGSFESRIKVSKINYNIANDNAINNWLKKKKMAAH